MPQTADVIIVGGGLAGLAGAKTLEEIGIGCSLLEASERIGGRVQTDSIDGFCGTSDSRFGMQGKYDGSIQAVYRVRDKEHGTEQPKPIIGLKELGRLSGHDVGRCYTL